LISTSEFRKGTKIEYKEDPYEIIDFQHVKMARGGAIVRSKIKNLRTGSIIEGTFKGGERFNTPQLEEKTMQYLYKQADTYFFMDMESYEQSSLTAGQLGDSKRFLRENMEVRVLYYRGSPITVELPMFVELKIVQTAPDIRGDTATGGSKPAVLETGAIIKVPLHLKEADVVKVDTRTGEYIERVK